MAGDGGRAGRFGGRERLGALAVAVVLGAAAAGLAVALGGDDGGKTPVGAGKQPVGEVGPGRTTTTSDPGKPAADPEPDPLCAAHDVLTGTVESLGTIDGPADLEVFVEAQVTFHSTAAAAEPPPAGDAFAAMAAYYEAQRDFYSARGWQQQVDIGDAALVPRPPSDGSATRTAQILADRCGVTVGPDTPA